MRSAHPHNVSTGHVFIDQLLAKAEAVEELHLSGQFLITIADQRKRGRRANDVMTHACELGHDVVASRKPCAQRSFRNPIVDVENSQGG
jgi:hypothetical protein